MLNGHVKITTSMQIPLPTLDKTIDFGLMHLQHRIGALAHSQPPLGYRRPRQQR